jgi:calcineurin-like phosphoesterase
MDKDICLNKMIDKVPGERMHPAHGEGTVCGIFVEIDDDTGLANSVAPIRMGPQLLQARP